MADTNPTGGNEINKTGRFIAGVLLIASTFFTLYFIIGLWPNRTPAVNTSDDGSWYHFKLFHVTLIEDSCKKTGPADSSAKKSTALQDSVKITTDSLAAAGKRSDSVAIARFSKLKESLEKQLKTANPADMKAKPEETVTECRIHLNTLLLLLVALMGLLGNLIHIASSFTTYVGTNDFKRSWILWYFVKPFTAAALALVVYFIIRAGFISYGSGAANISLYGILALSALAGLFTDSATLKLKEIFEVIFRPKDDRGDKLSDASISNVNPTSIPPDTESPITILGKNLDKAGLKVTLDGQAMTPASIASDKIVINYKPTDAAKAAGKAVLVVVDKDNKPVLPSKDIIIKPSNQ